MVAANGDEINVDGKRLALVCNSAGATIAAVTALKCKLEGGPALKGQLLFCPMTDANFETSSYSEYAEGYLITKNTMKWFWDNHVPDLAPLRSVARRSTAIVAHDQSRAARTTIEKNNNTFQE